MIVWCSLCLLVVRINGIVVVWVCIGLYVFFVCSLCVVCGLLLGCYSLWLC